MGSQSWTNTIQGLGLPGPERASRHGDCRLRRKKATVPVCRSLREPFNLKINRLWDTFLVESKTVRGLHDVRRLVYF